MPQIITCPDCQRKLRVPEDLLGKKVRCPGCSVMFKAVAVGAGAVEEPIEDPLEEPEEEPVGRRRTSGRDERYSDSPRSRKRFDEDEDDRPRRRRDDDYDDEERGPSLSSQKSGWAKVRTGINLVMIGTWVWLGGSVLGGLGGLLGIVLLGSAATSRTFESAATSGGFGLILLGLSVILYRICQFAELVLRAVGFGLCMAVPAKRGTGLKPLAITAFSLAIADALFTVVNLVAGAGYSTMAQGARGYGGGGIGGLSLGLGFFLWLAGLASVVVFLFFLRSSCNATRNRDLAGNCLMMAIVLVVYDVIKWIIIVVLVMATIGSAFFALRSVSQTQSAQGAANTMGAMVIISLVVFSLLILIYLGLQVWYILLLKKVRDAVASYRRRL